VKLRRTIVVHTRLAGHAARVHAARAGENGAQILTMGQLAARQAGGLLRPIHPDDLKIAVREALATVQLGELEPIKGLPGMVRAAVGTLDKVWNAGIDLSREKHPRLQSLRGLEEEVLRRLPPSMKRPQDLVELARARIGFAKAVLGPIEIHGHSEMSPYWRPLLAALSEIVPVIWIAGSRHVPDWIRQTRAEIRTEPASKAQPILYSCAHPYHEAVEAFRWMRGLLAAGAARPEDIAIAAASPADFDDHVLALSRDCNIPVHFVHGTKGPPQALPVTLTRLRVDDRLEPATHVIFASAMALASAPRPYVRLLALNTGRWPRGISEDRLIPDHVMPIEQLDPLPISEADRRDFETIAAAAKAVTVSFSRRDVEGRLLGRSPLVAGMQEEIYLGRARIPEHAESESDRLFARPGEFAALPAGISALACWRDWQRSEITPHDGFVGSAHPRLHKVFDSAMSATSLRMLLRDPIRFIWRYALGWKQPEDADEPLTVDPLAFGNLVHGVLRIAVEKLESADGFGAASAVNLEKAIRDAVREIATEWEGKQPVPPAVIWRNTLDRTAAMSMAALRHPLGAMPGQNSWAEIPFGAQREAKRKNLPWDVAKAVEIPGTGIRIQGQIDRLDLAGDMKCARVIDYKTGRLNKNMADVVIKGGSELQRCLYAFAVKTLIGKGVKVEASLLYPGAADGGQAIFPLQEVDDVLARLATALGIARKNVTRGIVAPGVDAEDQWNDFAFALPASPNYLDRKREPARERLGEGANVWAEP
jgi:hypothetical protein